jgi:hypothetical protein
VPKSIVDDTSLYLDDRIETAETLNGDLDKAHIWSEKWLVKFSPQKNEFMILSMNPQFLYGHQDIN